MIFTYSVINVDSYYSPTPTHLKYESHAPTISPPHNIPSTDE